MNSAAGDSCYFVMTVVGHGLIFFFFFFCGRSVGEEKDGGRGQIHAWMRRGSYLHAPLSPLHLTPHLWALWPMA